MVTLIYHGNGHLKSKPFDDQTNPHGLKYERICLFASPILEKRIHIFEKHICRFYEKVFKRKYDKLCLQKQNTPT